MRPTVDWTFLGALSVLSALTAVVHCSSTTTKGVEAVSIDLGVCILNHITEPPEQIAVTCGATSVEDVAKVIAAHKAAMVREGSALPPCGSR